MKKPRLIALLLFVLTSFSAFSQGEWVEEMFNPQTGLRTGKIEVDGDIYEIKPNARLGGADLSGADLSGAFLWRANLTGANLSGVIIHEYAKGLPSNLFPDPKDQKIAELETNIADKDTQITELQNASHAKDTQIAELEQRPTAEQLATVEAERDARPTQEAFDAVVAERDTKIDNINELQSLVTAKNTTIAELEKRPTAEQLATAEAERDARPTTDQLQDARNGSIVVDGQNGEATITFNIEESEDLKTWQKTGETITKTIQLKEGKKFYRFALDK